MYLNTSLLAVPYSNDLVDLTALMCREAESQTGKEKHGGSHKKVEEDQRIKEKQRVTERDTEVKLAENIRAHQDTDVCYSISRQLVINISYLLLIYYGCPQQ